MELFEGILLGELDRSIGLPPLWQVIYHEGVRDNHILFSEEDLKAFDGTTEKPEPLTSKDSEKVSLASLSLLKAHDLSSMKIIIRSLDYTQRRALFALYLHALRFWQNHLKKILN